MDHARLLQAVGSVTCVTAFRFLPIGLGKRWNWSTYPLLARSSHSSTRSRNSPHSLHLPVTRYSPIRDSCAALMLATVNVIRAARHRRLDAPYLRNTCLCVSVLPWRAHLLPPPEGVVFGRTGTTLPATPCHMSYDIRCYRDGSRQASRMYPQPYWESSGQVPAG